MSKLIFSIDIEEWFHSANIAPYKSKITSSHSSMPMVKDLLEFLDLKDIKGTFFCLGVIAQEHPQLIREISEKGHEIASHGWDHTIISEMSSNELEDDIKKSTEVLSKYSNQEIIGYRSPCFSQNKFLDDILMKCGYKYTSMGISSFLHDRYAKNDYIGNKLPDFPLPVAKIFNIRIPATGGGWFRLFPTHTQKTLLKLSAEEPKVFYCHPWDFDHFQDDLDFLPFHVRFRHFVNVNKALSKLDYLNFEKYPLSFLIQNDLKQDYI